MAGLRGKTFITKYKAALEMNRQERVVPEPLNLNGNFLQIDSWKLQDFLHYHQCVKSTHLN